jgi:hypothetical protein
MKSTGIKLLTAKILTLLVFSGLAVQSQAQEHHWKPEVGVFTGPYLISFAQQILPSVGGRISTRLPTNLIDVLELQAFGANVGGVSYYLGEIGLRNEFNFQRINGLFLFGFDWHYIRAKSAQQYSLSQGWHIGTGLNVELSRNLFFRNDYVMRFGSRKALLVTVGFSWVFGGGS